MTAPNAAPAGGEKIAPVQGFAAGIPWAMHLRAYDVYCKRYGEQKALIDLEVRGCRGGFSTGELDMFIPGWRDELSTIRKQRDMIFALRAERDEARAALATVQGDAVEAVQRHLMVSMAFEARATAAERERDEMRAKAMIAFTAICEARGYEAHCGDPSGLKHHLIAAGTALSDILAPALADRPTAGRTDGSSTEGGRDDG